MATSLKTDGLGFLLSDVSRLMRRAFERHAVAAGITLAQARLLLHIHRHEGVRQVDLADLLEIQPMTLARQLDQLVEQGWVERRPSPTDRRAYLVFLCEAATPMLERIADIATCIRQEALAGIDAKDIETTLKVVQTMRRNLSLR
jgi:DNA-binding MarR family transcriptional regulator